jgi:hypothetical protein
MPTLLELHPLHGSLPSRIEPFAAVFLDLRNALELVYVPFMGIGISAGLGAVGTGVTMASLGDGIVLLLLGRAS